MGFSSQDDLVNELSTNGKIWRSDWNKITGVASYAAGRWYDFSQLAGTPVANAYAGTSLAATLCDDTSGFGIYHGGNVSTDTKHILNVGATSAIASAAPSVLMLVDFLMYYPGINMNVATTQTLTNGVSLSRYTNGQGVRAFLSVTSATGATAHSLTSAAGITYTNQAGTGSRKLPFTVNLTASAIVGHLTHSGTAISNYGPFLPLASGDTGIRSVQDITLSAASGSGTASLVLCRPLTTIPLPTAAVYSERDLLNQLPSLPRVIDGACLGFLYFAGAATAASTNFFGHIESAWG